MANAARPAHRPPAALLGAPAERLCAKLREGHSLKRACADAGVAYDTARWWLHHGEGEGAREPYRSFAAAVREAEADGKRHAPSAPPAGRPPAPIPPAQQAVLLDGLRRGWTYHAACRRAGVSLSTFASWLRLGGYPRRLSVARPVADAWVEEPYRSFVAAVLAAEDAARAA